MRLTLLCACSTVLAAACGAAPLGTAHQPVVNGDLAPGDPAVVAVLGPGWLCSGTLVTPRVVLTARHCLTGVKAKDMNVFFGSTLRGDGGAEGIRIAGADLVYDQRGDIGLILLERKAPEGIAPIPILRDPNAVTVGMRARVVGFGLTGPNDDESARSGTKHQGQVELTAVLDAAYSYKRAPSMICNGDSGGPLLVSVNGVEHLAGDNVFGEDSCATWGQSVRIVSYLHDFIDPFLTRVAEGAAPGGGRCFYPEHCAAGTTCSPGPAGLTFCTKACAARADCPEGMTCTGGSCVYPMPSSVAPGAPCQSGAQCPTGLCVAGACTARCFPEEPTTVACAPGYACVGDPRGLTTHGFVCTKSAGPAPGTGGGGCSLGGDAAGAGGALLLALAMALLASRRARRG